MRRHFKVIRCWLVFIDTPGQIKGGAVTGAEKPTLPIVRQRRLRTRLEFVRRRTTEMGTNTDNHQILRLAGTDLIAGVLRSLLGRLALGLWVCQLVVEFWQCGELLRRSTDNPNWLAAPLHRHFFARHESRNISFDSRSCGLGFFGRQKRTDKRDDCCDTANGTSATGRDQPCSLAGVI